MYSYGAKYGIWYEYDEEGNLIREIDTDEGYDFSWEEVIRYCWKHEIPLALGYVDSGYYTSIYKETDEETGRPFWRIDYQSKAEEITILDLDGKTGKELRREVVEFINN